jgi:hypothetical protein
MTPERMATLVGRWVRFYTRDLPASVARRRIDEIDADLHDHIAHERVRGISDPRITLSVAARMLRGLAADLSWRGRTTRKAASRPAVRIALATALVLLLPAVAMLVTDEVDWGVFDFVFAAVLVGGTGLLLHHLARKKAGTIAYLTVATVIGVAAVVLGEADDAPGLVAFGFLLILATVTLAVRTAQRTR